AGRHPRGLRDEHERRRAVGSGRGGGRRRRAGLRARRCEERREQDRQAQGNRGCGHGVRAPPSGHGAVPPRWPGRARPRMARRRGGRCRWGRGCLVPDPLRTAAYASRTTLGGVLPERLRPLVQATIDLSDRFRAAGHTLYLVGGSVRDAIVSEPGAAVAEGDRDLDFTADARPDSIERLVSGWADVVWTQGKRFGTTGCR